MLVLSAVAVFLVDGRPADAASILLDPPPGWNGIMVSGSVTAGWRQSGGAATVSTSASSFKLVNSFPPRTPGEVINGSTLHLTSLPFSGGTKDKAEVSLAYGVTVGTLSPTSSDKFNFTINAQTSATTAQVDFGGAVGVANADAFVEAEFLFQTFSPVPPSALAAVAMPALPILSPETGTVKTMNATADIGPFFAPTRIVMGEGFPGSIEPLRLDPATTDAFIYRMKYSMVTSYGFDPTVSLAFEGSMERSSVPEIGMVHAPLALLAALAGLIESRSRRSSCP